MIDAYNPTLVTSANARHDHARTCKQQSVGDCATCRANVLWFAGLSLPQLAMVLQDRGKVKTR